MNDSENDIEKQNNDSSKKSESSTAEEIELIEDKEAAAQDFKARLEKVKSALKHCEQERKEYLDGWQRARAEHINYRNDEGKRFEDTGRFVASSIVSDLLPVLDSFAALEKSFKGEPRPDMSGRDLAFPHGIPPEVEKGILLIKSQLHDILKKRGLVPIEVEPGDAFDPSRHEALEQVEVSEKEKDGAILEELQKGYMIHDRVLRPAKVKVGVYKE